MKTSSRSSVCTAILSALLSACTTVDVSPKDSLTSTAAQLGVSPSSIVQQHPVRFATSRPGDRYAQFQLGIYTQTKTEVVLFSYEPRAKSFQKVLTLPIGKIDQAAIESWGMFDHLKQLQITAAGAVLAINFNNSSDAMAGSIETTKPPYDSLLAAGVKPGQPYGRVLPSEVQNFVVPIIIPAK